MTEYYSQHDRLFVAVDCIIFGLNHGDLSLLLTKRRFEPEKGKWSLMGGFVEADESVEAAAQRVLHDLTGLHDVYMEQVGAFGAVDRDPGERVVSVAYYALINFDDLDREAMEKLDARWIGINELPPLCFDHPEMIAKARRALRRRFSTEPAAFRLLPKLFTMSQMQRLYETILDEEVDKRNFRKRVAELRCVVPTNLIDKRGSRRGARLFRFDVEEFRQHPQFKL